MRKLVLKIILTTMMSEGLISFPLDNKTKKFGANDVIGKKVEAVNFPFFTRHGIALR